MDLTCALVVLNYNGRGLLEKCLPTVVAAAKADGGKHEVVLLDNGSSDGSLEWTQTHLPGVTSVRAASNKFLVSYNSFLIQTKHPLVFLLNNDVALQKNSLTPLLKHFSDSKVFSVSPLVLNDEGKTVENGRTYLYFSLGRFYYKQVDLRAGLTATASTAAGIYDREKLLAIGGFDDLLLPMYGEEMDLTLSAYRRGWIVRFDPESTVYHKGGATINSTVSKAHRRKYIVKNRHLSMIKHIHCKRYLYPYVLWSVLLLPLRIILFDRAYLSGTWMALHQIKKALERRVREQAVTVKPEAELFRLLKRLKTEITF